MATVNCLSSVRPQRNAFLISIDEPEWKSCCLQLLDLCTKTWGGYGNIIIPTDGKTIEPYFWDLLEKFEPDELAVYQRTGRDILREAPLRFEKVFGRHIEAWEKQIGEPTQSFQATSIRENLLDSSVDEFTITKELQTELRDRLSPFYFQDQVVDRVFANNDPDYPQTKMEFVLPSLKRAVDEAIYFEAADQDLSLWAGTELGFASKDTRAMLVKAGVRIIEEEATAVTISARLFERGRGFKDNVPLPTLSDLTKSNLYGYSSAKYRDWSLPTIIIAGDSVKDFCLYQSMSRMQGRVFWLPPWLNRETSGDLDKSECARNHDVFMFLNSLFMFTQYSNRHTGATLLTSITLGVEQLGLLREKLQKYSLRELSWKAVTLANVPEQPALRLYEANNAFMFSLEASSDSSTLSAFQSRRPKTFSKLQPTEIRWISELRFPSTQLPMHPAIAPWMMSGQLSKSARTSKNSLNYVNVNFFVSGTDDDETASMRADIRIPGPRQVFEIISAFAGLRVEVSDKGIYSQVMVEKLGGLLPAIQFFRSNAGISFVKAYQSEPSKGIGTYLTDERRRYLHFEHLEALCGGKEEATTLTDQFIRNRVFNRGFIFRCEFCRRSSWYPVGQISETFECSRCHRVQRFTSLHWKSPEQPLWYHQLDEVIYQAIANDGHIPVLALGVLSERHDHQISFADELKYQEAGATGRWMEADLNCVVQGDIIVGEAKKADRLASSAKHERDIVERYSNLAQRLQASRVVFATAAPKWRPETEKLIRDGFRDSRIRVHLFNHDDLYGIHNLWVM